MRTAEIVSSSLGESGDEQTATAVPGQPQQRPVTRNTKRRALAGLLVALSLFAAACQPSPSGPAVQSVQPDGTVGRPPSVLARDLGVSAVINGRVHWVFGDTIYTPQACDGTNMRNATAAVGTTADIHTVTEPVDPCGAPYEMYEPQVGRDDTGARIVFWPDTMVAHPNGVDGIIYRERVRVVSATDMTVEDTAVDELSAASPTRIDRSDETVLFGPDDHSYVSGNLVVDGFIYLYTANLDYYLARVPVASYRDRSAYRFWDGSAWVENEDVAAEVVLNGATQEDRTGGLGGLTVLFDVHLGKYLMVHSRPFKNDLALRTATLPEGPWSAPTYLDVPDAVTGAIYGNYSARAHPEFSTDLGKTVLLTYARARGGFRGDLQVVRVVLA